MTQLEFPYELCCEPKAFVASTIFLLFCWLRKCTELVSFTHTHVYYSDRVSLQRKLARDSSIFYWKCLWRQHITALLQQLCRLSIILASATAVSIPTSCTRPLQLAVSSSPSTRHAEAAFSRTDPTSRIQESFLTCTTLKNKPQTHQFRHHICPHMMLHLFLMSTDVFSIWIKRPFVLF